MLCCALHFLPSPTSLLHLGTVSLQQALHCSNQASCSHQHTRRGSVRASIRSHLGSAPTALGPTRFGWWCTTAADLQRQNTPCCSVVAVFSVFSVFALAESSFGDHTITHPVHPSSLRKLTRRGTPRSYLACTPGHQLPEDLPGFQRARHHRHGLEHLATSKRFRHRNTTISLPQHCKPFPGTVALGCQPDWWSLCGLGGSLKHVCLGWAAADCQLARCQSFL